LPNLRHDRVTQIEAENFNRGSGGFYDPQGKSHVGNGESSQAILAPPGGDWYKYTVNVPADGWYRAEARVHAHGANEGIRLDFGDDSVNFYPPNNNAWSTVQAGVSNGSGETFVYLSYGVQTLKLDITSTLGPDVDWLRLIPVNAVPDGESQIVTGIPVPYPAKSPVMTHSAATTIQTEDFDRGGTSIGYSDYWTGNSSTYRAEELVEEREVVGLEARHVAPAQRNDVGNITQESQQQADRSRRNAE
jgi:hypothetical protein